MTRKQKILIGAMWLMAIFASVTLIAAKAWRNRVEAATPVSSGTESNLRPIVDVPDFQLVDQDNKPVTNETLRGRPWVAAFIFTTCGTACPMMSAKMSALQEAIPDKEIHLVSITVNPEHDSPAVLKEYAKNFKADETRWHFLTGKSDDIAALSKGMYQPLQPATDDEPILHSERLILVDALGKVRAVYNSKDEEQLKQLKLDAATLAAEARGGTHG